MIRCRSHLVTDLEQFMDRFLEILGVISRTVIRLFMVSAARADGLIAMVHKLEYSQEARSQVLSLWFMLSWIDSWCSVNTIQCWLLQDVFSTSIKAWRSSWEVYFLSIPSEDPQSKTRSTTNSIQRFASARKLPFSIASLISYQPMSNCPNNAAKSRRASRYTLPY